DYGALTHRVPGALPQDVASSSAAGSRHTNLAAVEFAARSRRVSELDHAAAVGAEIGEIGRIAFAAAVVPPHHRHLAGAEVIALDAVDARLLGLGRDRSQAVPVELLGAAARAPSAGNVLEFDRGRVAASDNAEGQESQAGHERATMFRSHMPLLAS